jgi:hypothetical protein
MKGQAQVYAAAGAVAVVLIVVLIGVYTFATVFNVYPHDQTITNETLCSTCANSTLYAFTYRPVTNSTLVCTNGSNSMTLGSDYNTYQTSSFSYLNLTDMSKTYVLTNCTYNFDEANANEQSFFDTSGPTIYSGFTLLSIAGIALAAVLIVTIVVMLRD